MKVYYVRWLDAVASAGWSDTVDAPEPAVIHSVGFRIRKTKDHVVLATSLGEDGEHNATITIPRGMITDMHRIV